jgi:hypothetical protein
VELELWYNYFVKKFLAIIFIVFVIAIGVFVYVIFPLGYPSKSNHSNSNNVLELKLLKPSGGEVWKIGSKEVISLSLNGLKDYYRIGFLLGSNSGSGGVLAIIPESALYSDQYEFVVPGDFIASTDSGYGVYGNKIIAPGKYWLEVKIYDGEPCLENCPIVEGVSPSMVKVIAVQKSSGDITIE